MSARVPVFAVPAELGAYRSVIAELPLSAEVASGPAGAIVVLDARESDDWETALSGALTDDALGWVRVLNGGGRLETEGTSPAADPPTSSVSALLEADGGIPAIVTWRRTHESPWLRVSSFGATEVEVVVDDGAGCAWVATRSSDGERVVSSGFEEAARRELRRAIEAARASVWPDDLTNLAADLRLQGQVCAVGHRTNTHAPNTDTL